jgi:two-component system sensor histidine kinase KdpD
VIEVAEDTPSRFVLVDARLTSAALAHVLENAAHYSPPGSTIVITHRWTADGLELSVRDEGPGFAASDREHLFERFYRGRAATQHASGSGMGLSIARALVAAQGGRIWVENRTERGAAVFIVVPTVAPALDEPEEEP